MTSVAWFQNNDKLKGEVEEMMIDTTVDEIYPDNAHEEIPVPADDDISQLTEDIYENKSKNDQTKSVPLNIKEPKLVIMVNDKNKAFSNLDLDNTDEIGVGSPLTEEKSPEDDGDVERERFVFEENQQNETYEQDDEDLKKDMKKQWFYVIWFAYLSHQFENNIGGPTKEFLRPKQSVNFTPLFVAPATVIRDFTVQTKENMNVSLKSVQILSEDFGNECVTNIKQVGNQASDSMQRAMLQIHNFFLNVRSSTENGMHSFNENLISSGEQFGNWFHSQKEAFHVSLQENGQRIGAASNRSARQTAKAIGRGVKAVRRFGSIVIEATSNAAQSSNKATRDFIIEKITIQL